MIRHRVKPFENPILLVEEEFDPERALWIPGKKKIFLPAAKPESISWDIETRIIDFAFPRDSWDAIRSYLADCAPGRCNWLGIPREDPRNLQIRTWNDVQRSTVPAFRSSRRQIQFTD